MQVLARSGHAGQHPTGDQGLQWSRPKHSHPMASSTNHRLIVALDHEDSATSRALVERLGDRIGFYKIGLGSLGPEGFALLQEIRIHHRKRVFLDLKLFDIASTVTRAVRNLARLQPEFLTVHGDPHVVRAAVKGRTGQRPRILAVTILTSLSRDDLDDSLYHAGDMHEIVTLRADRAMAAGADGIICSPREARAIRALPAARGKIVVTPGIRLAGGTADDQKRVWTPAMALANGADYLVVGRPITQAADPGAAAERILESLGSPDTRQ